MLLLFSFLSSSLIKSGLADQSDDDDDEQEADSISEGRASRAAI